MDEISSNELIQHFLSSIIVGNPDTKRVMSNEIHSRYMPTQRVLTSPLVIKMITTGKSVIPTADAATFQIFI